MIKNGPGFWYWVFWVSVIATALWVIAKLLGFIQTPTILNVFPIISGIAAMIGIGITFGHYFQKTNFAFNKIHKIESRQNRMAHSLINLEKDMRIVKKDISIMKKDLDTTNQKVDNIGKDVSIIKKDIGVIKNKIK